MYRLLIPLLVLAALVWMAIEFSDTRSRPDVVFVTGSEVFTLDPQRMSYLGDMRMGSALYEGLVRLDLEQGDVVPAAASSWTTTDDGRIWTFELRPDSRWSDGSPVTAHDFVWSWLRLLTPDTAADYSSLFFMIKGSRDFWEWRTAQLDEAVAAGQVDGPSLWEEAEARFTDIVGI
ncbi:MAG: ABC transporter substrate-binding protein, partial [Phycisphaerales bacterium]|nr:ABC transporter substrate-binding protein [Phycisphaerales bacterium]